MVKKWWAVCYGTACRWVGPCGTAGEAAFEAFGVRPTQWGRQVTVMWFPRNPRYAPRTQRDPFLDGLFKRHKERTGNVVV